MQAHGHFNMYREGRLLICQPMGAFNLSGAMAYEQQFKEVVAPLLGAPWGIVELTEEFEAAGPDVIERFNRQFHWCAANGCDFMAVVMPEQGFRRYMANQMLADVPFIESRYFDDAASAIAWLQSALSKCDAR